MVIHKKIWIKGASMPIYFCNYSLCLYEPQASEIWNEVTCKNCLRKRKNWEKKDD